MTAATPWLSFSVENYIPGKDLLEQTRSVAETLGNYLEIVKAVLNTIKTFLVDLGNPIKVLVDALVAAINSILESLRQTGIYMWLLLPDFTNDPQLKRLRGGWPGFLQRWKGSLQDAKDINRPKPQAGLTNSGFVLVVVDSNGWPGIQKGWTVLQKLFKGNEGQVIPPYPAPVNFKVRQSNRNGDIVDGLAELFKDPNKIEKPAFALEWALGQTVPTADQHLQHS